LIGDKKARATKIASLDQKVNAVFATFNAPNARFTTAGLKKTIAQLKQIQSSINLSRRGSLKALAQTVSLGMKNRGVVAQYEDLVAMSGKIAAMLVTAKVSMADENPAEEPLENHDIVTIDSNGYVADDNCALPVDEDADEQLPSSEDDLSVAGEGKNTFEQDEEENLEGNPTDGLAEGAVAHNSNEPRSAGPPDTNTNKNIPQDGLAVAARKPAATAALPPPAPAFPPKPATAPGAKPVKPVAPPTAGKKANVDPSTPEEIVQQNSENNPLDGLTSTARSGKKAPVAADADPDAEEFHEELNQMDPPEEFAALDGEEVTPEQDGIDNDSTADLDEDDEENAPLEDLLDLPDSGVDAILAAEILNEDMPQNDGGDEGGDETQTINASVTTRGNRAATRSRRLATASRMDSRNSNEGFVLQALANEIME
jgi:hypothetical protein